MKKIQYISPTCKVVDVNVQSRFLNFSITGGTGSTDIGTRPGESDPNEGYADVKGDGGFWDEW